MTPLNLRNVKVTRKQAASILAASFPRYKGRKISVCFTESVTFYDTNWSGGTRNKYVALGSNGDSFVFNAPAPWVNIVENTTVKLALDFVIVCHSNFCGSDAGITIYAHPAHAAKWLPQEKHDYLIEGKCKDSRFDGPTINFSHSIQAYSEEDARAFIKAEYDKSHFEIVIEKCEPVRLIGPSY